jgi:hypothetical protein
LAAVYVARKLGVVVLTNDADLLRYGAVCVDRRGVVYGMLNEVPLCVPVFLLSLLMMFLVDGKLSAVNISRTP